MSVYKEKSAIFAKIFGNLDNDSDEDEDESENGDLPLACKTIRPTKRNSSIVSVETMSQESPPKVIKSSPQQKPTEIKEKSTDDVITIESTSSDRDITDDIRPSSNDTYYDVDSTTGSEIIELEPNYTVPISNYLKDTSLSQEAPTGRRESSFSEDLSYKLKINRSGRYERINTSYKTKLRDALKEVLADLEATHKSLVLLRDGETLSLDETPHSLKLAPGDILDAIEVQPSKLTAEPDGKTKQAASSNINLGADSNRIMLRLQDGNRKHSKEFHVTMDEPLLRLKQEYAKEFEIDIESMKLTFDGDLVKDEDTAESLDMDDGCVIDVMLPQTISYVAPPSPVDLVSPVKTPPSCARGGGRGRGRGRDRARGRQTRNSRGQR